MASELEKEFYEQTNKIMDDLPYRPQDDAREVNGIVMGDYGDAIIITMVSEGRMTRFRCKPSVVTALLEEAARICARRLNNG